MSFLNRVFPPVIDNRFPGHWLALYIFYALTAVTLWRSQHHIFAADGGAQSIATIPLDTYTSGGAEATVFMFALWGASQLGLALVYLLAAIRYKAMIPLLYLLFTFEYALRFSLPYFKVPIETVGTAPGAVGNLVFMLLGPVLFALSVAGKRPAG